MSFQHPAYSPPDFEQPVLRQAPPAVFAPVEQDGVAPAGFHATSIYPEYLRLAEGSWRLLRQSRMDCVVVLEPGGELAVKELRRLKRGESVALGRRENGEDGIYVHSQPFAWTSQGGDKFAFRTQASRESPFSIDYDELYDLLEHERGQGFIAWVLGPAVVFDADSRDALAWLINQGYAHALLAGNALAAHDVEAALFGTALGQEIYSKRSIHQGHYHHLDALNLVRGLGSLELAVSQGLIKNGVMHAAVWRGIPLVLAGSIRDDGPLPGVVADAYQAQDRMRELLRQATTVLGLATQLHTIAAGNMVPCYQVGREGKVRPVYFYTVDMSEFAAGKLANRGSLAARAILTNVQDFLVNVARGLKGGCGGASSCG